MKRAVLVCLSNVILASTPGCGSEETSEPAARDEGAVESSSPYEAAFRLIPATDGLGNGSERCAVRRTTGAFGPAAADGESRAIELGAGEKRHRFELPADLARTITWPGRSLLNGREWPGFDQGPLHAKLTSSVASAALPDGGVRLTFNVYGFREDSFQYWSRDYAVVEFDGAGALRSITSESFTSTRMIAVGFALPWGGGSAEGIACRVEP